MQFVYGTPTNLFVFFVLFFPPKQEELWEEILR